MPEDRDYTCFICDAPAWQAMTGVKWPAPIAPGTGIALCDKCIEKPCEEIADHVIRYAKTLRIASN